MAVSNKEATPVCALSSDLGFVADLLVVGATAFVAFGKRFGHIRVGILPLDFFEFSCHLGRHLIVFLAARPGVQLLGVHNFAGEIAPYE